MNQILTKQQAIAIHEVNGEPTMSSLRIAEVTGKEHDNVIKTIEKVFLDCNIDAVKFNANYKSDNNRTVKHYLLPEREFNLVVSGYSPKYRLQLIDELMSYRKNNSSNILSEKKLELELKKLEAETDTFLIENNLKQLKMLQDFGCNIDPIALMNTDDIKSKLPKHIGEAISSTVSDIRLDVRAYSATYLLKKFDVDVLARDWNICMEQLGYVESYKYKGKSLKKFTNRTNWYGYNKYASSVSKLPYQILYYEDRFLDLVQLLRNDGYID